MVIEENKLPLKPAVKIYLCSGLHSLPDRAKPVESPFHWAGFCAIGQ
ncbi:MAG: hypothetical protein KME33_35750 [Aetokthonos hydrillicola CCALA 1050]|nr:hypothetical protein [Aetokthonos hydrillicola CCALA 1050]